MSFMLVLKVLRQRAWIVGWSFFAVMLGAILLLLLVPPRYDGVAVAGIDPSVGDPLSGAISSPNAMGILQGNFVALAKSNQVALAVVKKLNLDSDPSSQAQYRNSNDSGVLDIQQWLANQLIDHVEAKFATGSMIMNLTYKGSTPQQAALFANSFMSTFIDAAIAMKVAAAQKAASWFNPQIDKIRADLQDSRAQLAKFQTETKLLQPSAADAESDQVMAVNNELSRAKAELVQMQAQRTTPAQTSAGGTEAQTVDTQTLISLRSNLSGVDAEIARLQTEVGANNQRLLEKFALRQSLKKQLDAQIEDFTKKLDDRIAAQKLKIANLEKTNTEKVAHMIDIQGQRQQLTSMERQVRFYQEELDRVQRAASQSRLQSQLSFSNISVIDQATPPTSVSFPKPIIVIPLAIGVGLGLGVLLALLAEALHRRLRTSEDLQYAVNAPLLGVMTNIHPSRPSLVSRIASRLLLPVAIRTR